MHLLVHGRALPAAERRWEKGSFPFGWQVYFDGRACLDEKRAAKRQPSLDWLIANRDMLPKLQKAKEREGDGACGMKRGRAKTQPSATSGKTHAMRMLAEHSALKPYKVNMTSLKTDWLYGLQEKGKEKDWQPEGLAR